MILRVAVPVALLALAGCAAPGPPFDVRIEAVGHDGLTVMILPSRADSKDGWWTEEDGEYPHRWEHAPYCPAGGDADSHAEMPCESAPVYILPPPVPVDHPGLGRELAFQVEDGIVTLRLERPMELRIMGRDPCVTPEPDVEKVSGAATRTGVGWDVRGQSLFRLPPCA
ncbi:MAG TPA: hypothetical protein VFH47_00375 [Candidatus Thermoplasmatota archaeon]|nr:hypothetical protein [Candidatus Thermoplasmatota archaeon]